MTYFAGSMMIDPRSVFAGIRAMKKTGATPPARWGIRWWPREFWLHAWTPMWHEGRGPYLTMGLWIVAITRGY